MNLKQIGVIHSSHKQASGTPIQASMAQGIEGTVEIFPEYALGLKDLDGFERIWLLYWFDRIVDASLIVTPFLDDKPHGIFATRSPCRPNPIGISSVRVVRLVNNLITVTDIDILDGTPLLDIKPYVPSFDVFDAKRCGWLDGPGTGLHIADRRFEKPCE
jgi:tRNA-Thr(GGU) m(6)t(6)A37 methyltransferase TsaA